MVYNRMEMTNAKEARARVKIDRLLEQAGWHFFGDEGNVLLELNVKLTRGEIDSFGDDFEHTKNGFIDYLLLNKDGRPLVVLEAKREDRNPLDGKEQARNYARSEEVRFVILSNGNIHYLWDLTRGDPKIIVEFPTQEAFQQRLDFKPINRRPLDDEEVGEDYIALTQKPDFKDDPRYRQIESRDQYLADERLRILRPYQLDAIHALQQSAATGGKDCFLFEMATGTGKTLVSAAIIKLFIRTRNAERVLFLVDRLELENQTLKNFKHYLANDITSLIYKQNRDDWRKADVVISTIQSLSSQNKYKRLFSPIDFDLVIADESHRAIGENSRAVLEYFISYKLGLTATPKNYLKNINAKKLSERDPRAWERRQLLDTYKTFGCEAGEPTFRFSLLAGVEQGFLINPTVVDARTRMTTELLSRRGFTAAIEDEDGNEGEQIFYPKNFERTLFSDETNMVFCQAFISHALTDPISGELGKSIVFCVSQAHASKITQLLNRVASQRWPGKYRSDFAVQVTSSITDSQRFTINFASNNLNGKTQFLESYQSSKTRVCVTVGMMTTGYDCEDILNIVLMRPIFSPTNFIQIKGRGTRRHTFEYTDENGQKHSAKKESFKLFDFFAVYEYFEKKFIYDEVLKLPVGSTQTNTEAPFSTGTYELVLSEADRIETLTETPIGIAGMKIDRKYSGKVRQILTDDAEITAAMDDGQPRRAAQIAREKYENKAELYMTLDKIRKSEKLDRRISWEELVEWSYGWIAHLQSKDEKLEEECQKFISIHKPDSKYVPHIKNYLKSYVTDAKFRDIIDRGKISELNVYAGFTAPEYRELDGWRETVPAYAKDYISLSTYMS